MRVVEQSFRKKSYLCHFFDHGLLESLRIGIACYSNAKSNSACLSYSSGRITSADCSC